MLEITQATAVRSEGGWRVNWRISNPGNAALEIRTAWLPHSRFRGAAWTLTPPLHLASGGEASLASELAWDGAEVENAFLILRTDHGRVFARLHVAAAPDGTPVVRCESVTASLD
jgi:hypothetical protein